MKTLAFWLCFTALAIAAAAPSKTQAPEAPPLPLYVQRALKTLNANDLKGDLSFLSSDALQGRFTPSPGLDVAAEFIASKFRAAGLEPGGNREYFQTAEMVERKFPALTRNLTIDIGARNLVALPASVTVDSANEALKLDRVPVLVLPSKDVELLKKAQVKGKAVVVFEGYDQNLTREQTVALYRKDRAFDRAVAESNALVSITVLQHKRRSFGPEPLLFAEQAAAERTPRLSIVGDDFAKWATSNNPEAATLSVDVPAPEDKKFTVENVIGILRGSDPVLSKTAVLLTAHYDHIGTVETAKGLTMSDTNGSTDRIYNGANDDGSGTVSVIEIARALAKMQPRPKRSIVFMTFFGEERGELGSQFYGRHPVFPIDQTVADLNLEQVGRTDATNGKQLNNASVTGFDYSDVTQFLIRAGERVGIKVYRDAEASDQYFARSDNAALALKGVPAHTLCVAFDYSDYHGLGDEWQKIDYENMAKVDRMAALALVDMANSRKAPQWNEHNPQTERFRTARAASLGTR